MAWRSRRSGRSGSVVLVAVALGCAGVEGAPAGEAGAAPAMRQGPRLATAPARLVSPIEPSAVLNRRPRFLSVAPRQAREGESYQYGVVAADPVGDALHLSLLRAPEGAALDGALLRWKPSHAQAGRRQRFTLRAVDGHGASREQTWNVIPRLEPAHPSRPEATHHR